MNRKGQNVIDGLASLVVPVVTVGIVLVIGFLILAEAQDQIVSIDGITNESNTSQLSVGYNATSTTINALQDIPTWLPIIIITVIGALLIGLVAVFRRKM